MSSDEPPSYGGWLSARRGSARKQAGAAGRSSEADRSSVGRKSAATEDVGSALSEDSASSVPQSPRAGKQLTVSLAKMGNYVASGGRKLTKKSSPRKKSSRRGATPASARCETPPPRSSAQCSFRDRAVTTARRRQTNAARASGDIDAKGSGRNSLGSSGGYSLGIKSIKGMTSKIANSIGSARGQQQGPVNADTPRYESGGGGGALPQPGTPRYGAHEEPEAATGPGTPRYGEGGEGPPSPTSTAAEKLADISIDVGGDSAAIAELAAEAARLTAETGLSLEASLAVETAKWRLRAAVGGEGHQPRCALAELHDAICSARSADAGHKSKWPQLMARAEKAAAPAVSRVLEAKGVVIDPNMCQLEQHMQRMREEQIGNAVGSMASGALRSVTRAKALAIHRCLMAALDDVEQQFVGGMEQFSRSGLPEHFRKQAVTRELCATAVHAHRLEMEAEYALLDIEQVLRERMVRELPDLKTLDLDSGKPPSMEQAPLSFLTAVVMGSAGLGVPAPIADWLGVQVQPRPAS